MRFFKLRDKFNLIFLSIIFLSFLNLTGCSYLNFDSNDQQAPVSSINSIGASYYTVQEGDTIEGISDGFGVSIGNLALWNQLSPPYSLTPGQKLRLKPGAPENKKPTSSAPLLASMEPGLVLPSANNSDSSNAFHHDSSVKERKYSETLPAPINARPNSNSSANLASLPTVSQTGWIWPMTGHVSPDNSGGIDIDAKSHHANVVAAKAGKVIYAGPDVSGDGKLVILDNSDGYLSAYGNLESISGHIQEGAVLDHADSIGKVRSVLHFDIRQSGNSLDAQKFLP